MRILDRSVYVGPSLYAHFPVIRLELDLGALEAWPTGRLGGVFVDALSEALPGLAEHGCSYREPGGFFRRMREGEGTWLGHVLEHVAIELQNIAGEAVTFGKTRSAAAPGVYTVVYEYAQRDEGCAAGELGLRLLCWLLPDAVRPAGSVPEGWNWPEARDQFIRFAQRRALGPSTASLVRAAETRGIPWLRLNDQSLVQLGHGKFQQRIQATVTSRTPHISVELASDKEETNKILAGLGLPVPQQELVQSETQAVRAAQRIGFPVVTKPYNGNHGRGISIRLTSDEEVAHGYSVAREHSRSVIVETFLEGDDHRLLVVNGELVAATRRTPGHVVGDGEHSVAQLTEIVNSDPRRGVGHEKVLTRLELDAQAAGAERSADGDFAPPRDGARKEEVGDVGAGDQENERDRAKKNNQRRPHPADHLIVKFVERPAKTRLRRVVIRKSLQPTSDEGIDLRLRLCERHTRFEPADDAEAARTARFQIVFGKSNRFPDIDLRSEGAALPIEEWKRKLEFFRHDSNDGVAAPIERKLLADELGIGIKAAFPKTFTDYDDVVVAFAKFALREGAAANRLNAEHGKHTWSHHRAGDAFGHFASGEVEIDVIKTGDLETLQLLFVIQIFRRRDGDLVQTLRGKFLPQENELLRVFVRQRAKEERVDEAKHCGVRADRERHGDNGNEGKARRVNQAPEGEAKILNHIIRRAALSWDRCGQRGARGASRR